MSIRVRYFGSLRERMGRVDDILAAEGIDTVSDVWKAVSEGQYLPDRILCAVNMDYAEPDAPVKDGDEVAFFPPVTGGLDVLIELRLTGFDPYAELQRYQTETLGHAGKYGATCSFVGTMRDFNENETVRCMFLDHYPGMTERQLKRIVEEAKTRWRFLDALVIHRVGEIFPDQPIVLVAVWSSHRGAAFDACRYIMEELKSRAPFWKKETLALGERWLEKNTSGY